MCVIYTLFLYSKQNCYFPLIPTVLYTKFIIMHAFWEHVYIFDQVSKIIHFSCYPLYITFNISPFGNYVYSQSIQVYLPNIECVHVMYVCACVQMWMNVVWRICPCAMAMHYAVTRREGSAALVRLATLEMDLNVVILSIPAKHNPNVCCLSHIPFMYSHSTKQWQFNG